MMSPDPSFGGGFDFMFTLVPILIGVVFVIVIIGFISSGTRYVKNARSPRSSVYAKVAAKRTEVRGSSSHVHDDAVHSHHSAHTYYYITLEFDNGERKEFLDVKKLYGLLVEGDTGYASIQGDWLVAYERDVAPSL